MIKKNFPFFFLFITSFTIVSQTTDLAVLVEAQDLNGNGISQIQIYQEFQYVITIINSGNAVINSTFSQTLNQDVTVISYSSQNNLGGASNVDDFNLNGAVFSGTIQNMPNNSSVQVKLVVMAPQFLGGIATTVSVSPPQNTQDINPSNNQSIISIDVVDVAIDFTVIQSQIAPPQGTSISMWNDTVTYDFTITNNSSITFPLNGFSGVFELNTSLDYGRPIIQLMSIECLGGTNGTDCPDVSSLNPLPVIVSSVEPVFNLLGLIEFPSGGSLSFRVVYKFLDPLCAIDQQPLAVDSYVVLNLNHPNVSSNNSNQINLTLLTAELCELTDICIETIQTNPAPSTLVQWGEEVTFITTACNNGPLPAPMRFFLQNLSVNVDWEVIALTCVGTTGNVFCSDFTLTSNDILWTTNEFMLPPNTTITIETIVVFNEPECSTGIANTIAHIRSGVNLLSSQIIDPNNTNNSDSDYVTLPPSPVCASADLSISKIQVHPALPIGSSSSTPANWGDVTYEITISNPSDNDTFIELSDYMPQNFNPFVMAALVSVECIGVTGTANCQNIEHTNIGVSLDGVPQSGILDVFWEIRSEDNWSLPAQSSVTFQVVVNWSPECTAQNIIATNSVSVSHSGSVIDIDNTNNTAMAQTYFAPCVDLIVQTFPSFTQVNVNQNFDWIIDITNSNTSSNAVNISFEDILGPEFTITGTPICEITSGTAICIPTFNVNSNTVTGNIPNMEAGSTVRISIPVSAPAFGGAFNNRAEAIPSAANNEELTPDTNISISNVQVIAPRLIKEFEPENINLGEESTLTFTINNLASNPSQNSISFIDYLPLGLTLTGAPIWVNSNGCTATFLGIFGDDFVGVSDLAFPEGVATCSFSVTVIADSVGEFVNDDSNFTDQINIDTSQSFAVLNVLMDTSNVDIEVLKDVSPQEANLGDEVEFTITITNLGVTAATDIVISENLPIGYQYLGATTTLGTYNSASNEWSVPLLNPNQIETLAVTARIISTHDLLNIAFLENLNETDRNETNNENSAEVVIGDCLKIPQGFSPTSDGLNDFFVIPCIEDYTNNHLKIYNRLGVQIYESNNYQNNWDGTANMGFPNNSNQLPTGTYYYILEIDGFSKALVGWVYLNY